MRSEKLFVGVHQMALPDGSKNLPLRRILVLLCDTQRMTARCNGSGRHQEHLLAFSVKFGYLCHKGSHYIHIQASRATGEQACAYLGYDTLIRACARCV